MRKDFTAAITTNCNHRFHFQ